MDRIEVVALLLAAAVLSWLLFIPPIIGLANNGDFSKILGRFDLAAPSEDEFLYVSREYTFHPSNHWESGMRTSEALLVAPALLINRMVSKEGRFDIRVMGAIHAAGFLLAFALWLPLIRDWSLPRRLILIGLSLLVWADLAYVTNFNSFYMDTGALLFLLLAVVFFLRGHTVGFLAACALFLTAKTQHAPLGILLAFLAYKMAPRFKILAVGLVCAAMLFGWTGVPYGYTAPAIFNAIFYGVLPTSSDSTRDLQELGLDESFRHYIGTHSYMAGSPLGDADFIRSFLQKTGYGRLAVFYARHPGHALLRLRAGLDEAALQRAPNLGNYERASGRPPYSQSHAFSIWSDLKRKLFTNRGFAYLLFFLVAAAVCLRYSRTSGAVLAAMGIAALLIGSLADACEIARHLFLFNALADLLFLSACAFWIREEEVRGMDGFDLPRREDRTHDTA